MEKLTHLPNVWQRQPLHVRERKSQILSQPFDDRVAPIGALLLQNNDSSDLPVEEKQFAVHGRQRAMTRFGDQLRQAGQDRGVIRLGRNQRSHLLRRRLRGL